MNSILEEIEKLSFTQPQTIPQREEWKETVQEVKKIIEKKADALLVNKEPVEFLLDSDEIPEDRFYADVKSAHLECSLKEARQIILLYFFQEPVHVLTAWHLIPPFQAGLGTRI